MPNLIKILPDSLANQIAAGEVIQRPASVVKELVENAIDAGASEITINIKDAGRTLIQVIDNGLGMSTDDARLAFERHATSKIKSSKDLFSINTKGFRGEALASIAAVAQVDLKTRQEADNIGTHIYIEASEVKLIESVNTPKGSNFMVKNLFFNIPARRKFLKSDRTEFTHILNELYRIAIPHYDIAFTVIHNENLVLKLYPENLKERIVNVFERSMSKQLVSISVDGGFIKISGYVGRPEFAVKQNPKQYFFVNNRFMKNSYFHKAILMAYQNLLNADQKPNYFIFFQIEPERIDVNIHPTKTEINFDDARGIFQILLTAIRKALTEFDITPAIDFENTEFVNMDFDDNDDIKVPELGINPNYNPFDSVEKEIDFHSKISHRSDLDFSSDEEQIFDDDMDTERQKIAKQYLIFKGKYLLTPVKSGLMVINIPRALKQIKFEEILNKLSTQKSSIQTIYPVKINLSTQEQVAFDDIKQKLTDIGFEFEQINNRSYNITAIPSYIELGKVDEMIKNLIRLAQLTDVDVEGLSLEDIAMQILGKNVYTIEANIGQSEADGIVNKLFSCSSHQYTFDGKTIISIVDSEYFESIFE
jgi:DNA mismatch repair protein MutL